MKDLEAKKNKAKELLKEVRSLAKRGFNQGEILDKLGFKNPFTLNNHLVKASQLAKIPIPQFAQRQKEGAKREEYAEVRRRGKGNAFGVNIPQEPLERAGFTAGDKVRIKVRKLAVTISKLEK